MKVTKPKQNQILLEDEGFKDFNPEVQSKNTGLLEVDNFYNAFILGYRMPGMEASKQIFMFNNEVSAATLIASMLHNLVTHNALTLEACQEIVNMVKESFAEEE